MIVVKIVLAISAIAYWYITGNWWLAGVGILASVIWSDDLFLVTILLSAAIAYICIYFLWKDAAIFFRGEQTDVLVVTLAMAFSGMLRAMFSFWGIR